MQAADIRRHPNDAFAVSQVYSTAIADGCSQCNINNLCLRLLHKTFTGTRFTTPGQWRTTASPSLRATCRIKCFQERNLLDMRRFSCVAAVMLGKQTCLLVPVKALSSRRRNRWLTVDWLHRVSISGAVDLASQPIADCRGVGWDTF